MHEQLHKVLVVDDDADMRAIIETRIRALGAEYEEAVDGSAALDILRVDVPTVMLLDLDMPNTSGEIVIDEMLRGNAPIVPTVVLTGHSERLSGIPTWMPRVEKGASFDTIIEAIQMAVDMFCQNDVRDLLSIQATAVRVKREVKKMIAQLSSGI